MRNRLALVLPLLAVTACAGSCLDEEKKSAPTPAATGSSSKPTKFARPLTPGAAPTAYQAADTD